MCRENATERLHDLQASKEDRQRMLTILKRIQQTDDPDTTLEQNDSGSETDAVGISNAVLQNLMLEVMHGHHVYSCDKKANLVCPLLQAQLQRLSRK